MPEFSTSIIDFEKLPSEVIDWVKPRLMKDETLKLSIISIIKFHEEFPTFYFLTTQKLLILSTHYGQKNKVHWYSSDRIYFLGDIYNVYISAKGAGKYGEFENYGKFNNLIEYHNIKLIFGEESDYSHDHNCGFALEPKIANTFETTLLSLLWAIKPHA